MKKLWLGFIVLLLSLGLILGNRVSLILAQERVFSLEELAQYNGQDGQPVYVGYEGKVYDFSVSKLWKEGKHFELTAGQDLTGRLGDQHGDEVIKIFPVVGVLAAGPVDADSLTSQTVTAQSVDRPSSQPSIFASRIRFLGISILGWTGIWMGVFFVLTFATCFVMPWSKQPVPWRGSKPGSDPLDSAANRLPWTSVHQYFVWFTIVLGIVHGVIGFLQLLGIYL